MMMIVMFLLPPQPLPQERAKGASLERLRFNPQNYTILPDVAIPKNRYSALTQGAASTPKGIAGYVETRMEAKCRKKH